MNKSQKILQWSLWGGAVYFLFVSIVHMVGLKVPILFVYFNVTSYSYQDRIISFLSFGWAMFLFSGYESVKNNALGIIKYVLFAGIGGIIGLCVINIYTDFNQLSGGINALIFWFETLIFMTYFIWLILCYKTAIKALKK